MMTLITYLIRNKIDYIIDYETMLTNKYYSLRGGYSDRKLVNCLIKTDLKLGSNNTPLENTNIFLYKFINECKN